MKKPNSMYTWRLFSLAAVFFVVAGVFTVKSQYGMYYPVEDATFDDFTENVATPPPQTTEEYEMNYEEIPDERDPQTIYQYEEIPEEETVEEEVAPDFDQMSQQELMDYYNQLMQQLEQAKEEETSEPDVEDEQESQVVLPGEEGEEEGIPSFEAFGLWGDLNRPKEEKKFVDISNKIKELLEDDGSFTIKKGWQDKVKLFKDPAPGVSKGIELVIVDKNEDDIWYFRGNEAEEISFPENFTKIRVPFAALKGEKPYVLYGVYGNLNAPKGSKEVVDITLKLSGLKKKGEIELLGGQYKHSLLNIRDPKSGWFKSASCLYVNEKGVLCYSRATEVEEWAMPDKKDQLNYIVSPERPEPKASDVNIIYAAIGDLNRPEHEGKWESEFFTDFVQSKVEGEIFTLDVKNIVAEAAKGFGAGFGIGMGVGAGVGAVAAVTTGPGGMALGALTGAGVGAVVGGGIGSAVEFFKAVGEKVNPSGVIILAEYQDVVYFFRGNNTEKITFPDDFTKLSDLAKGTATDDDEKKSKGAKGQDNWIIYGAFGNLNAASSNESEVADVTGKLHKMEEDGELHIDGEKSKTEQSIFGVDPMRTWIKGGLIIYKEDDLLHVSLKSEYEEVDIPNDADRVEEEE